MFFNNYNRENKCNYKNIIDFLNKANEHLNVPLSLESDLKKYKTSIKDDAVIELINELKEPMAELNNIQLRQLEFIKSDINYIINNNIKDEKKIEKTFDMLVDLLYWFGEEIKDLYFEFVEYVKKRNIDIAIDYEKIYNEIINEEVKKMANNKENEKDTSVRVNWDIRIFQKMDSNH